MRARALKWASLGWALSGCGDAAMSADGGEMSTTLGGGTDADDDGSGDDAGSSGGGSAGQGGREDEGGSAGSDDGSGDDPSPPVDCPDPWTLEIVDEDGGADSDIEIGPDGAVEIFYLGGTFPQAQVVRHAHGTGGSWTVLEIADTLDANQLSFTPYRAGVMLDGTIAPDGSLHVGYRHPLFKPAIAHFEGGAWVTEIPFVVGASAQYLNPAIAAHPDGEIELAFQSTYGFTGEGVGVTIATLQEEAWDQSSIGTPKGRGDVAFLVGDAARHLAFLGGAFDDGPPSYATDAGGSWAIESVDLEVGWAQAIEIALDGTGVPHLAFHGGGETRPEGVYLARRENDGSWTVDLVAEVALDHVAMEQRLGLALDADGLVHLAFAGPQEVSYARGTPGSWSIEAVGSPSWWGDHLSMTLDAEGRPHVAFRSLEEVPRLVHAARDCGG